MREIGQIEPDSAQNPGIEINGFMRGPIPAQLRGKFFLTD
jgi:hypothetical protein